MKPTYILSSEESELLLAFESATSLEKLSKLVNKDISNISRSFIKIAEKIPALEKRNNRWQLTDLGKKLNQFTQDSIQFQQSLLHHQSYLRIGTNREFASRLLGPSVAELKKLFPNTQLKISSYEQGIEQTLIDGLIDIGFDCERPYSPDISYRLCLTEDILTVCTPEFKKKHIKDFRNESFYNLPHLLCDRLHPDKILKRLDNKLNVFASFNDIATTRAACLSGIGWAVLPKYAIASELKNKDLVIISEQPVGKSPYGVWWLRNRKNLEPQALLLKEWLQSTKIVK